MSEESYEFLVHKKHPSESIADERRQPRFHSDVGYFHFLSSRYNNSEHYKNLGGLHETISQVNSKNRPTTNRERSAYEQSFDRGILLGIHAMHYEFSNSEQLLYGARALEQICTSINESSREYETTMSHDELVRFLLLDYAFKEYDKATAYHKLLEDFQTDNKVHDSVNVHAETDFYPQLLFQSGFGLVHGAIAETPRLYKNELALWHELEDE